MIAQKLLNGIAVLIVLLELRNSQNCNSNNNCNSYSKSDCKVVTFVKCDVIIR